MLRYTDEAGNTSYRTARGVQMTNTEMITNFRLRIDSFTTPVGVFEYHAQAAQACKAAGLNPGTSYEPSEHIKHSVEMASVKDTLKAINARLKAANIEPEEYDFRTYDVT